MFRYYSETGTEQNSEFLFLSLDRRQTRQVVQARDLVASSGSGPVSLGATSHACCDTVR